MNNTEFLPNRAARRKKGLRKQKLAVRIDVPVDQAARRGVKHGDRFVIPGKRLVNGQLEPCKTGEETLFLANVVQPIKGEADADPHVAPGQPRE